MSDLLRVENLRAGYGGEPVLQGVSLHVGKGEIVAVIGRNGVGKSTLMRALIGLIPVSQGSIALNGEVINALPAQHRAKRGMGYIPQGRDVFPRLSVRENLLVGETARRGGTPDYAKVYEFFPILKERATQAAGTLSGGQQQQLAIGRAMIGGPELMLLDEPSEGIQPSIVKDIARNIRKLNAETGLTVLFVEQNLDLIVSLAQRGFVIDKGRIIAEVPPEDIRDREKVKKWLAL
ncbi:ABC transporter ATP-binding protein [Tabrizicola soli]|uniref:ABC transporter ATP-binding protein n=1 Tax=Tabrizicola soli TaxID=2185115 RepID=A0ABV7DX56_9RHOB|nr:ABC transporter ATP-binding protein [Tabrizicola soli]